MRQLKGKDDEEEVGLKMFTISMDYFYMSKNDEKAIETSSYQLSENLTSAAESRSSREFEGRMSARSFSKISPKVRRGCSGEGLCANAPQTNICTIKKNQRTDFRLGFIMIFFTSTNGFAHFLAACNRPSEWKPRFKDSYPIQNQRQLELRFEKMNFEMKQER